MSQHASDCFSQTVIDWQMQHGRHDLPWQKNRTAYRVWLSEVMLQQTQVSTVLPYFQRFTDRFADVHSLAMAHIDEVLFLWSGLGYYSRARNLHRAARMVIADFSGIFPSNLEDLQKLPGVGRSTAGAIMVFAYNQAVAILDGNVKRVLARYFALRKPINLSATEKSLWHLSERHLPETNIIPYTQGMMDLGSMVCVRGQPHCRECPLQHSCVALANNLQQDLPIRKKSKDKPIRQGDFVLVVHGQRVLLKQKKARGVWHGLWNLPELKELEEINPQSIAMGPKWLEFRHTFSHFHLDCSIFQAVVDQRLSLPEGWVWYNCECPPPIGLATPMQKIISQWYLTELDEGVAEVSQFYTPQR